MSKTAMSKATQAMFVLSILACIAVLTVIGVQLSRSSTPPAVSGHVEKSDVVLKLTPAEIRETLENKEPTVGTLVEHKRGPNTAVAHKIDASSDKSMVDSLDFISRQLDPAGQQQLQDDYNVIQTALESQAVSDDLKDADSLAAVRIALDGKTAADLSVIAEQLKTKI